MALDIKALSHLPEIAARLDSRVGTRRAGPFRFQLGLDAQVLELTHQRVLDAQGRFQSAPLAQVAERLAPEVMASGIFGTNSIEGGTLTEEETRRLLDLPADSGVAEEERHALNLKEAYQLAMTASAAPVWRGDPGLDGRIPCLARTPRRGGCAGPDPGTPCPSLPGAHPPLLGWQRPRWADARGKPVARGGL